MTEQEATDKLEQLVGSPARCFRLMELYSSAKRQVSTNMFKFCKDQRTVESVFQQRASQEGGYSVEAILFYLNNIR